METLELTKYVYKSSLAWLLQIKIKQANVMTVIIQYECNSVKFTIK